MELQVLPGAQVPPGEQLRVQVARALGQLAGPEQAPPQQAWEPARLPLEPLQFPAWGADPQPSPASSAAGNVISKQ